LDPNWLRSEGVFDRERYAELNTIAAEMMAAYGDTTPEHVLGLWAGEIGYATPKVDVRAAVFSGERVLLVRERADSAWSARCWRRRGSPCAPLTWPRWRHLVVGFVN
jgi:hypothetical protein